MKLIYTDARVNTACPKCSAQPGDPCRSPRNKNVYPPHERRVWAWQHDPRYNAADYAPKVTPGEFQTLLSSMRVAK